MVGRGLPSPGADKGEPCHWPMRSTLPALNFGRSNQRKKEEGGKKKEKRKKGKRKK